MIHSQKQIVKYGLNLAQEYSFHVSFMDFPQHIRGAISRINKTPIILVNDDDRPERINFTIAYEISHILLKHKPHVKSPDQENEAFSYAADLLIDTAELHGRAYEPLEELKKDFYWCSHEVIARKCLQHREAVMTIFDNYHMTSRIQSPLLGQDRRTPLQDFEQDVVNKCRKLKRRYRARNREMECWANYIEDPPGNPIRRIILFTEGNTQGQGVHSPNSQLPSVEFEDLSQERDIDYWSGEEPTGEE